MPKIKKDSNFTDLVYPEEYGEIILELCSAEIDEDGEWSVSNHQSTTYAKDQLEKNELFAVHVFSSPNEMTYYEFENRFLDSGFLSPIPNSKYPFHYYFNLPVKNWGDARKSS